MVLVDFTLAERWRIFGELSFAPVARDRQRTRGVTTTVRAAAAREAQGIDPAEAPARRQAEAALMQRLL
ncbi:MAG: hypothetical protein JNL19_08485 [Burkholderiales bacterium]|nr:hypothetical protein [Burkholderiales bacterium]